jgi:FkbM family methyltransferase
MASPRVNTSHWKTAVTDLFRRAQHIAAKKSWFLYQSQSFTVEDRGVVMPVANGVGLDMIGEGPQELAKLIEWTYSQRQGAFVDIGANVGRVLLHMVRYHRSVPYIGFDPQLQAAHHCFRIIRANNLSHTHCILPIGLSDSPGKATFFTNDDTDTSGTINVETRPAEHYQLRSQIALGRGDDYLSDVPEIAFVKVDAEGAEVAILRGLQRTIAKHLPVIAFEVLPIAELESGRPLSEAWHRKRHEMAAARRAHAREMREILESHGYTIGTFDTEFRPGAQLESSHYEGFDFVAVHPRATGRALTPASAANDQTER